MYKKKPSNLNFCLCFLLCFLLVLTGCLSGKPAESLPSEPTQEISSEPATEPADILVPVLDVPEEIIPDHADVNYTDMVYERPDLDAVYANFQKALELTAQSNADEELFALYDTLLDQISQVSTMDTLASLQSDMDLSNTYYEEEMTLLDNELTRIDNRMNELTEAILQSSYADIFTSKYGDDFVERYEKFSKLNSPEIEVLSEQENALVTEYKKLLSKEYTTTYKGEEVTLNDLDYSDPDVATPYYEIYAKKNAECAQIYLKLVKIRVEIAHTLGYDSYADYAYDYLDRDFSKEDAAQFCQMVKEYIAPLASQLYSNYYLAVTMAQRGSSVSIEDGLPYLQTALNQEFPAAMSEALAYMLDHELYLFDDDPNMMPAGFTTIINDYATPFLFINTSVYTDPGTLFHEFGHYYNFYLMGRTRWNDSNNLDLAEVHSQGLELLMFPYYSDIYGKSAEAMQVSVICDLLDSILMGCCEDEFQQRVFENPDMTIDEMNELHGQLYEEYMGYPLYYEWVEIHHHFETPFYYISYATSAASAFEIWELSETNRPAALAAYRSITQNTINCGYLEPLKRAGLSNPFTSDMIEHLAETITEQYLSDNK